MSFLPENKKYNEMVKKATPASPIFKDTLCAFVTGGGICVMAQLLRFFFDTVNIADENSAILTSVTMIFLGGLLTALGVYDKIAKFGKAGTLVPISGFANSIVSSAIEYKSEGYITGVGTKMFIIAGPVLVYGITASIIYGIACYFIFL